MYDSRKTVPTFLVYGAGLVFLAGIGWAWLVQPASEFIGRVLNLSMPASVIATTSCLTTLGVQWLLIRLWRHWNTHKTQSPEGETIRLTPDKRDRIQTGQA